MWGNVGSALSIEDVADAIIEYRSKHGRKFKSLMRMCMDGSDLIFIDYRLQYFRNHFSPETLDKITANTTRQEVIIILNKGRE